MGRLGLCSIDDNDDALLHIDMSLPLKEGHRALFAASGPLTCGRKFRLQEKEEAKRSLELVSCGSGDGMLESVSLFGQSLDHFLSGSEKPRDGACTLPSDSTPLALLSSPSRKCHSVSPLHVRELVCMVWVCVA